MYPAFSDYEDFSDGGPFCGISGVLESFGFSDQTTENSGKWNVLSIMHGDVNGKEEFEDQTYRNPDGVTRQVSQGLRLKLRAY